MMVVSSSKRNLRVTRNGSKGENHGIRNQNRGTLRCARTLGLRHQSGRAYRSAQAGRRGRAYGLHRDRLELDENLLRQPGSGRHHDEPVPAPAGRPLSDPHRVRHGHRRRGLQRAAEGCRHGRCGRRGAAVGDRQQHLRLGFDLDRCRRDRRRSLRLLTIKNLNTNPRQRAGGFIIDIYNN